MTNRDSYIYEPQGTVDASVIWLHGLGADGNDFAGITEQLGLPSDHRVRFIFPNAPFINVTINQGMKMRGWYDIYDLNLLRKEDEPGVERSRLLLEALIAQEIAAGVSSKRIILAGFSQGGAIALYTGLRYPQSLGGIIVLSAYLPVADKFIPADYPANRNTPILIAHGLFDPVVPFSAGKSIYQTLHANNYTVSWSTYPIEHTLSPSEIVVIGEFICKSLGYA